MMRDFKVGTLRFGIERDEDGRTFFTACLVFNEDFEEVDEDEDKVICGWSAETMADLVKAIDNSFSDPEREEPAAPDRNAAIVADCIEALKSAGYGATPGSLASKVGIIARRDAEARAKARQRPDAMRAAVTAPEREEPSEPEPCIRPAPWNGSQQPSDPEPASAWATLPAEVRSAVAEFASPSPRPCDGRIGDPDKVAAVLHRWKAERTEGDSRDPAELGHLLGMAIDCLVLPGHVITGEDWERACILSGRACEPFLSHYLDRPEPDAASVEDISAIIEAHVTGGVQRATTAAAARHIVARFGSPPTVPVLALPSMDEVDEAVRNEMRRAGSLQVGRIRNAVLDLVRERQPAAFRNALAKWRGLPKEHRGRFVECGWSLVFAGAEACRVASILLDTLDALEGE